MCHYFHNHIWFLCWGALHHLPAALVKTQSGGPRIEFEGGDDDVRGERKRKIFPLHKNMFVFLWLLSIFSFLNTWYFHFLLKLKQSEEEKWLFEWANTKTCVLYVSNHNRAEHQPVPGSPSHCGEAKQATSCDDRSQADIILHKNVSKFEHGWIIKSLPHTSVSEIWSYSCVINLLVASFVSPEGQRWHSCLFVLLPGQAEGWARSERHIGRGFSRRRGGAFFLAGAQDASPAPNVPGLRLHAATFHRLPARVCRPQLSEGNRTSCLRLNDDTRTKINNKASS